MNTRRGLVVLALVVALGVTGWLLWVASIESPSGRPETTSRPSAPTVSPEVSSEATTSAQDIGLPPLEITPYRVIKSTDYRVIERGSWFTLARYRVQGDRPTTHQLQVNLNVRRADGARPTFVTVGWLVRPADDADRSPRRVGMQTFAVPDRTGDFPFQISHRHTTMTPAGRTLAQISIEGSGTVTTRLSVAKAIVWVEGR